MNLVIDVGNTFVKLAVFNNEKLIFNQRIKMVSIKKSILQLKKDYKHIEKVIISSVGRLESKDVDFIDKHFDVLVLNSKTELPFLNMYKTHKQRRVVFSFFAP